MDKYELTKRLPKNGNDVASAEELVRLGYPAVAPVLKSLFQWLETSDSDVEMVVRPFFASLGEPALGLAREALRAPIKPARKNALLKFVLPSWPSELIACLEEELMALVKSSECFYGLDAYALQLLIEKKVGDTIELERWRSFKIERLNAKLSVLQGTF